jgi:hypothetical protein
VYVGVSEETMVWGKGRTREQAPHCIQGLDFMGFATVKKPHQSSRC